MTKRGLVVGCLIAHSGTQSGGHDIAKDHGIILADSRDIAEIVALNEECAPSDDVKVLQDFIRSKVSDILACPLSK